METGFRNTKQHRWAAVFTVLLAIALVVGLLVAQSDFFSGKLVSAIGLVVMIAAITIVRFFDLLGINDRPALFLGAYNVTFVVGQLLILSPFHPLSFLWIILLIRTQSYLGNKWSTVWWGAFGVASLLGLLVADDTTITDAYFIVAQVGVALILSFTLKDAISQQQGFQRDKELLVEETRQLQKRLESMFNNLHLAIFGIDAEGKIVVYNNEALDIINQNIDLHGASVDDVLGLSDDNGDPLRVSSLMGADEKVDRRDIYLHLGMIERVPINLVFSKFAQSYPVSDSIRYMLSLRDISKEHKLNEEHSDFISVVSHELRTPIAIAEGQLSNAILLRDQDPSDLALKETLEQAHQQVKFLAELVNEVRTISKAERDELGELNLERIEPKKLIKQVMVGYEADAASNKLVLDMDIDEEVESIISSNSYILDILNNLVENAIKYTDEGSITIGVEQDDKLIRFFVRDTGIGVSHSDAKNIFDKFFRAEDVETRAHGGTGLGLYISQQLANRINARISMESELGKGSEFSLSVPRIGAQERDTKEVLRAEVDEFMNEV